MQSAVVEKGIDVENYKHARIDVLVGCIMAGVVVFFIIVACAATLFKSSTRVESAADAAQAPLAGKYCSWLFAFGLFNASLFAARAAAALPLGGSQQRSGLVWKTLTCRIIVLFRPSALW